MVLGANDAGSRSDAGTAAAHALQYPVGALTHTPHGVGVGVLLPYVMAFNAPARDPGVRRDRRRFGVPHW